MLPALIVAVLLALPGVALAADVVGTITILEGQAQIYRGSGRLLAAEGVRLSPGDIVETAAATFAQIELLDQSVAQFGPATRVMLSPPTARQKAPSRSMYVMEGWIKLIGAKKEASADAGFDIRSPQFEVAAAPAVTVLHASATGLDLFAENGNVRITERQPGGAAGSAVALKAGDFYQRRFPARGTVAGGVAPAFVAEMPRAFRDSLPPRIERFRERAVQAKDGPPVAYADVQDWLQAEPALRRPLMPRWRPKLQEPAFRAAVAAHMNAHMEWDPILFPEKYRPKEPARPPASRAASLPASSASAAR